MSEKISTSLKMMFIGACGTVTGSCTLLRYTRADKEKNILIDCGQVQNENFEYGSFQYLMNIAPKIDMIFLTHAHQDHIGLLPFLIEYGFNGIVWCTRATFDASLIMLKDQMTIEKRSENEIDAILRMIKFNPVEDYKKDFHFGTTWCGLSDGLQVGFLRSGHILGSCSLQFRWIWTETSSENKQKFDWKYISFSGDLGPVKSNEENSLCLKDIQFPYYGNSNPYLVMESTYGSHAREYFYDVTEKRSSELQKIINETIEKKGTVLIPAFALNRSQEILLDLYYLEKNYKIGKGFPIEMTGEYRKNPQITLSVSFNKSSVYDFSENHEKRIREVLKKAGIYESDIKKLKKIAYVDLSDQINEEILNIDIEDMRVKSRVRICSNLIHQVNKVYHRNFFDSTMDKKGEIKFVYMPKMFMQKFGLSQKNFDFEQARNLLHNALDCEDYREDKRIGKIVVASSGMCDKGKVTQILPEILKDPNSCVILSGYQAEGSNGWYLKNFKDFPEDEKYNTELDFGISDKKIRIKLCDVNCKIYDFSKYYSGHADQNVLSEYAHGITSKVQNYAECTVFLNHGKDESREALKEKILQMNNDSQCVDEQGNYCPHKLQVVLPKAQVWYTLSDSSCDVSQQEIQKNVENRICPVSEEERKFFETMPKKAVNYGKKSFTIEDIEVFYPENFTNEQVDSLMNAIRNSLL